jgi:hypothetical protein
MEKIIVFLKNGVTIGYWDPFDKKIRMKTISLISEKEIEYEYEQAMFHVHNNYQEVIFPVIVPFNNNNLHISNEVKANSKVIYDQLIKEHWPIRS